MHWDDLRIFLAIARGTSLSDAARHLRINQSTVSRRLTALERRLGTALVQRSRQGVSLTKAGEHLLLTAERVEADVLRAEAQIAGQDMRPSGSLTVTCPDILLDQYLAPHLARFSEAFPQIVLTVISSFQPVDVMRRDADVAIRVSADPPEDLVGRRVCGFAMAAYISKTRSLRKRAGPDGSGLEWIGWTDKDRTERLILRHFPKADIKHKTDGMVSMRNLVLAGMGTSVLPCYWADRELGLRRVYPQPVAETGLGLWVLAHPDVSTAARVRAFTGFISDTIKADRSMFEG